MCAVCLILLQDVVLVAETTRAKTCNCSEAIPVGGFPRHVRWPRRIGAESEQGRPALRRCAARIPCVARWPWLAVMEAAPTASSPAARASICSTGTTGALPPLGQGPLVPMRLAARVVLCIAINPARMRPSARDCRRASTWPQPRSDTETRHAHVARGHPSANTTANASAQHPQLHCAAACPPPSPAARWPPGGISLAAQGPLHPPAARRVLTAPPHALPRPRVACT